MVVQSIRNRKYYEVDVPVAVDFTEEPQIKFPFTATHIIIIARSTTDNGKVEFSFLRPDLDGEIYCYEGPLAMDDVFESRLWCKSSTSGMKLRVMIWRQ